MKCHIKQQLCVRLLEQMLPKAHRNLYHLQQTKASHGASPKYRKITSLNQKLMQSSLLKLF
jgi:hypothetical protein